MWRYALAAIAFAVFGSPAFAQTGVTPEALYQALLKGAQTPLPPGFTSINVTAVPIGDNEKTAKMIGAVQGQLKGGDPKAEFVIFVFASDSDGLAYYNARLALPPTKGKMLSFPPFAQCADINSLGYCEMFLQGRSTVLTAAASKANPGADEVIGTAYRYFLAVQQTLVASVATVVITPEGVNGCAMLTTAEIQEALNEPIQDGQRDPAGNCTWHGPGTDLVTVSPQPSGQAGFDDAKARMGGTQTFSGIGDGAFGFVSPAGFVQIFVIKGGRYVNFTLQSENKSAMQIAEGLAAKIAARL